MSGVPTPCSCHHSTLRVTPLTLRKGLFMGGILPSTWWALGSWLPPESYLCSSRAWVSPKHLLGLPRLWGPLDAQPDAAGPGFRAEVQKQDNRIRARGTAAAAWSGPREGGLAGAGGSGRSWFPFRVAGSGGIKDGRAGRLKSASSQIRWPLRQELPVKGQPGSSGQNTTTVTLTKTPDVLSAEVARVCAQSFGSSCFNCHCPPVRKQRHRELSEPTRGDPARSRAKLRLRLRSDAFLAFH